MPRLAAFPKAFMDELVVNGRMSLSEWIELASTLDIDGLEFYSGFLDLRDNAAWPRYRAEVESRGLTIPMLCCSPDFTHRDSEFRRKQVEQQLGWIEMAAALGGKFCRVLSGQRRPELAADEGIEYAATCIEACLPRAEQLGVTLILENHYKDNYWTYPEFAQRMELFCRLVDRVRSPWFGVNYDPSNTLICGEDYLELLRRVAPRVVTMHASDRYLAEGTLDDLRREENMTGYAQRLKHGVIGRGMIDYDAVFSTLAAAGFDGWISIEDGMNGMDDLHASVSFLRQKMQQYWP